MGLKTLGKKFMTARLQMNKYYSSNLAVFVFYSENFARKSEGGFLLNLKWIQFGKTLEAGIDLYNQEEYENAKNNFLKAMQMKEADFVTNFWLLRTCVMLMEYGQAVDYVDKCLKISPDLEEPLVIPWCNVMKELQQNLGTINIKILNNDTDQLLEHYQTNREFFWGDVVVFIGIFIASAIVPLILELTGILSSTFASELSGYALYLALISYYFYKPRLKPSLWKEINQVIIRLKELVNNSSFKKSLTIYFIFDVGYFIKMKLVLGKILENFYYIFKLPSYWPVFVLLAPIGEEMIFRGLLFKSINKHNTIAAYFITALLFYLWHGSEANPLHFIESLLFCWVYQKYQRLEAPIVLHSMHNTAILILSYC